MQQQTPNNVVTIRDNTFENLETGVVMYPDVYMDVPQNNQNFRFAVKTKVLGNIFNGNQAAIRFPEDVNKKTGFFGVYGFRDYDYFAGGASIQCNTFDSNDYGILIEQGSDLDKIGDVDQPAGNNFSNQQQNAVWNDGNFVLTYYSYDGSNDEDFGSIGTNNLGGTVEAQLPVNPPLLISQYCGNMGYNNGITVRKATNFLQKPIASEPLSQSYPNPTQAEAIIPYNLPKDCVKAVIIMNDLTGRQVRSYVLKTGKTNLTVDLSKLNSGIYTYSLIVDDKPVATKKLSVIR